MLSSKVPYRILSYPMFLLLSIGLLGIWTFISNMPNARAEADLLSSEEAYFTRLAEAALLQTKSKVTYDPAYVRIPYPNGDVSLDKGVCADVLIRAYRALGSDLQVLVHQDMAKHFKLYPKKWGLSRPDTNIDHRRVPNLMTFFKRQGAEMTISSDPKKYRTGDIVAWDLGGGITHIGFVLWTGSEPTRPLVVHNIGAGPQLEDVLFNWKIIGVYRYQPKRTR